LLYFEWYYHYLFSQKTSFLIIQLIHFKILLNLLAYHKSNNHHYFLNFRRRINIALILKYLLCTINFLKFKILVFEILFIFLIILLNLFLFLYKIYFKSFNNFFIIILIIILKLAFKLKVTRYFLQHYTILILNLNSIGKSSYIMLGC
jgi:hypothetical protein